MRQSDHARDALKHWWDLTTHTQCGCGALLRGRALLHDTVGPYNTHTTAQYSPVQHRTVQYSTVQHSQEKKATIGYLAGSWLAGSHAGRCIAAESSSPAPGPDRCHGCSSGGGGSSRPRQNTQQTMRTVQQRKSSRRDHAYKSWTRRLQQQVCVQAAADCCLVRP